MELIGIRTNVRPFGQAAVRTTDPLVALYGRNGAGKTRFLNSLADCLTGHGAPRSCHILVRADDERHAARTLAIVNYDVTDPSGELRPLDQRDIKLLVKSTLRTKPSSLSDISIDEIAGKVTKTAIYALEPSLIDDGWDVWACLPTPDHETSAIQSLTSEFQLGVNSAAHWRSNLYRHAIELQEALSRTQSDAEEYLDEAQSLLNEQQRFKEYTLELPSHVLNSYAQKSWNTPRRSIDATMDFIEDGLPIPIVHLGSTGTMPIEWLSDRAIDHVSVCTSTLEEFTSTFESSLTDTDAGVLLIPEMKSWLTAVETSANEIFASLLPGSPSLRLRVLEPRDWLKGRMLEWVCVSSTGQNIDDITIDDLSTAERRLGGLAIRWALSDMRGSDRQLLVLDEPERSLHRAAETQVADALARLRPGVSAIVATHSPTILNISGLAPAFVAKEDGSSEIRSMPPVSIHSLNELGLRPSDLLGTIKIFLLVEGEHDQIVIETLCADALAKSHTKVVPMRGGRKLPGSLESTLIYDLSDALTVAVLDNVDGPTMQDIWERAKEAVSEDGLDTGIRFLIENLSSTPSAEVEWIKTWMIRALRSDKQSRVIPYGLYAKDIVEYLPVESIVPRAKLTWSELRKDHEKAKLLDPAYKDFKTWLIKRHKASFTPPDIKQAALSVSTCPEELVRLGHQLRNLSMTQLGS